MARYGICSICKRLYKITENNEDSDICSSSSCQEQANKSVATSSTKKYVGNVVSTTYKEIPYAKLPKPVKELKAAVEKTEVKLPKKQKVKKTYAKTTAKKANKKAKIKIKIIKHGKKA